MRTIESYRGFKIKTCLAGGYFVCLGSNQVCTCMLSLADARAYVDAEGALERWRSSFSAVGLAKAIMARAGV